MMTEVVGSFAGYSFIRQLKTDRILIANFSVEINEICPEFNNFPENFSENLEA